MKQVDFSLFAATQAATLCPPAGAVQTANDVPALVAQPDTSGQRVDTLTHVGRRAIRRDACYSVLQRRGVLDVPRFVVVLHCPSGPRRYEYSLRPACSSGVQNSAVYQSLHRVRGAV